ncbi:N-acetylmuramoyl-L-alanine amidase [Streptomyces polygonati]|uniref:N-acetylmuramoyl-L-alanine amidase n=1 Tax=Streptomyces polygonati TaxID=1617087 RepID=A0ABV8HPM4_9ACTN
MATPMTASQFVKALKDEGATVAEHAGWRRHNRNGHGAWGPVHGVVIHHTADTDSLGLCYSGRSDLPGPLCHAHLAKDGTLTMVGNGRANHAGTFAANAVDAMTRGAAEHPRPDAAEPVDANTITYGVEIENLGDGKDPYPAVQYTAALKFAAAICRFHHWTAESVIGHKEGTRRKTDPSFDMNRFRADLADRLKSSTAD